MLPKDRPPTSPGEMLIEEYLRPRGITQVELAARMGVPVQRVNTIVNGKRGITEALDTTAEFWLGLQSGHDLWHAHRKREVARAKAQRTRVG
jgi:antitoxin HigA-1